MLFRSDAIHPGATEVCNDTDDDCDGGTDVDAVDASTWYADGDSDLFGDAGTSVAACDQPDGYVADATDCDDSNALANPTETEVCDGFDDDCDGVADGEDSADASTWYADTDGDGYGDAAVEVIACEAPTGYVADATDCDDEDDGANPGAAEVCDGVDDDCDGDVDEPDAEDAATWYADDDGDTSGDADVAEIGRAHV